VIWQSNLTISDPGTEQPIRAISDHYGRKTRPMLAGIGGLWMLGVLGLSLSSLAQAEPSSSMLGGWLQTKPSPQNMQMMLQGKDPALLQRLTDEMAAIQKNPNDQRALSSVGAICLKFSRVKTPVNMWGVWQDIAAKALERAIKLDSKDWMAWHNYGQLNFEAGDLWMVGDHSNAKRAVWAFSQAIALNPKSARSYMGRGWAYLELNDQARANADFQTTLRLDSSLRGDIEKEVAGIRQQKAQEAAARQTLKALSSVCDSDCQSGLSEARRNAARRANEAESRGDKDAARMIRNQAGIP
jgi:tetratricopeptide (TPR) repeat protein